jgi:hypothetical protein
MAMTEFYLGRNYTVAMQQQRQGKKLKIKKRRVGVYI